MNARPIVAGSKSQLLAMLLPMTLWLGGCGHGLEPPPPTPIGAVAGTVTYEGRWPDPDSLHDLRFVAFRFVPRDTSDFFRLNEFVFSQKLTFNVNQDAFVIDSVEAGTYVYNGIAQKFGSGAMDWRPVGIYAENGGNFTVPESDTARVHVHVDFDNIPIFPPP